MTQSNLRVTKHTVAAELNVQHGVARTPSVGGKMFRRTSESAGKIG